MGVNCRFLNTKLSLNYMVFRGHPRAYSDHSGGSEEFARAQTLRSSDAEQGNLGAQGPGDVGRQMGLGVPGKGTAPKHGGWLTGWFLFGSLPWT